MTNSDRETFVSYGELFCRSAQWCLDAERSLRSHIEEVDAPYNQVMELVADAEHRLAKDLSAYAEHGPEDIISTRVQYTLDIEQPPAPETPGAALKNVTQVNQLLSELIQDLANKAAPDDLRETMELLRVEIDRVNKQISMIRLSALDV